MAGKCLQCSILAEIDLSVLNGDYQIRIDLTDSELAITADINHLLEVVAVSYKFMRVYYTRTAGSATFETIVSIKE